MEILAFVKCIVFKWKGFDSRGVAGVDSMGRQAPFSAGSKMDLPLFRAEQISNVGGASVITYGKKGQRCYLVREGNE